MCLVGLALCTRHNCYNIRATWIIWCQDVKDQGNVEGDAMYTHVQLLKLRLEQGCNGLDFLQSRRINRRCHIHTLTWWRRFSIGGPSTISRNGQPKPAFSTGRLFQLRLFIIKEFRYKSVCYPWLVATWDLAICQYIWRYLYTDQWTMICSLWIICSLDRGFA